MNKSRQNKFLITVLIPLLINVTLFYVATKNHNMFIFCINIFCIVISLSLGILTLVRSKNIKSFIFRNMGISFIIISIELFCQIIFIAQHGYRCFLCSIIEIFIVISINIFVVLSMLINEKVKFKNRILIFISSTILIGLLCTLFKYVLTSRNIGLITIFIILKVVILTINYYKFKSMFQKLIKYLIILLLYEFIFIFTKENYGDLIFFFETIKYLLFYYMYIVTEEKFYYKSYLQEEKNLKKIQLKYSKMYKVLLRKNKELLYLKKLIEDSEEKKRNLIEEIKDGICMLSENKVTYINKSALKYFNNESLEELIGKDAVELMGKIIGNIDYKDSELKLNEINNIDISQGRLYKLADMTIEDREHIVYFFKLNHNDSVIYSKDITSINYSHKARRIYEECLEESNLKDEFYSNISHELRTPINIIYSAIQLNSLYLKEGNGNKIIINNKIINQNCRRLIRTINNFIDVNKVSGGYLKPNLKVYNVVSLIESISNGCNKYIKKIDNTLLFHSVEQEIYVRVDKDMLERAMLNILSNEVKYGQRYAVININIKLDNNEVVIEVKNNLYTINQEIIPMLFDKFSKLNKSLNREKEGCGLGLFLTKSLLELQGGTIDVESNKDTGTTFIIRLPRCINFNNEELGKNIDIENIEHKVDVEFSDIYL